MSNKRCPKCGFPKESETSDDICPRCGWNVSSGYEEVEMTYKNGNSTIVIRLNSEKDVYYEYTPNTIPLYEDAFGKYYRGKRNNLSVIQNVLICEFYTKHQCPEYLLGHLNVASHICFSHPNIIPPVDFVAVHDDSNQDYQLYFIVEEFHGATLSDFLKGNTCDSNENESLRDLYSLYLRDRTNFAHKVITDILQGLDFLHRLGVCVRYIDPRYIIIADDGRAKIIYNSFLYEIFLHRSNPLMYYVLPLKYCSPEIILQGNFYDNKSDIYSVGILFFYILTGHTPYQGLPYDIMYQHLHTKMPLYEIEDKQFRRIIKKATEKNPAKRFQSASEFLKVLEDDTNVYIPWYKKLFCFFHKGIRKHYILLSILLAFTFSPNSNAQNTMCINYKDGSVYEAPIESIDSITFIEKNVEQHEAILVGEWFWGNKDKGYFEVLTFNEDWTYTGYDYYLEYGFDTWTYGMYMANGIMLNLWSNGYGYRRTYRWFVSALTENALEVMTQMGGFTYYRVQPEIYSLKVGEESYECLEGDYYVFTDEVKVSANDGKLKGISEGTSYILKYNTKSGLIMAYKVIVENSINRLM